VDGRALRLERLTVPATVRPYAPADRAGLCRLVAAADAHDRAARALAPDASTGEPAYLFAPRRPVGLERGVTPGELRARDAGRAAGRRVLVAAGDDGELHGCAVTYPGRVDGEWAMELVVAPERRDGAAGPALVQAALGPLRGACVQTRLRDDECWAAAVVGAAGFVRARETAIMERRLPGRPTPLRPGGVTLRRYEEGDAPSWVAAFNSAFARHPGNLSYTLERWTRHVASSRFDPELSLVALDGDAIVGVCHGTSDPTPRRRGLAQLHIVGVVPTHQRRGLALALVVELLERLTRAGHRRIELDVDAENAGAIALYERLGFRRRELLVAYRCRP
jgi:mycothiol synthase